jgi:hypothetical protein
MGGEKETIVEQKGKSGEAKLSSFRIHENNGEVHFHDDVNNLKCAVPMGAWWKAWDRIRAEPGFWNYVDTSNNTAITVETLVDEEPLPTAVSFRPPEQPFPINGRLDVVISIDKITVSDDYSKLNTFSKRK